MRGRSHLFSRNLYDPALEGEPFVSQPNPLLLDPMKLNLTSITREAPHENMQGQHRAIIGDEGVMEGERAIESSRVENNKSAHVGAYTKVRVPVWVELYGMEYW